MLQTRCFLVWLLSTSFALDAAAADPAQAQKSEMPAFLESIGQAGNALLAKGCLDVTLYDGWEGNAVDPTGRKDSTKGLQKAIEDARANALVAFFPTGTYLVSGTLKCAKKPIRFHPSRKQWLTQDSRKVVALVGSTQGRRPVIRLADNSAGFQDPDRPCAIVHIWNQRTDDNTPPPVWRILGERQPGEGPGTANGFNMIMRGIVDSRNILITGLGGHTQIEQGRSLIHIEDSSDVIVAVAGLSKNNPQGATVLEKIGEGKPLTVSQDHSLALYKRGEVNDAAWERTPLAQARNGEKSSP